MDLNNDFDNSIGHIQGLFGKIHQAQCHTWYFPINNKIINKKRLLVIV